MKKLSAKLMINNIGLKILSVFVAFLIWLMVVNVDDPEKTKSFIITEKRIQITNVEEAQAKAEQAKEGKKVYSVVRNDDENGNVLVYVRARRSILDKLQTTDIVVEANMQNMSVQNTVPYEVTIPGVKRENIQCFPGAMSFELEDKSEQTYAISLSTIGQPASGYEIGSVEVKEGDTLIIAGPTSVTKIIDKVAVQVGVNNMIEDQIVPATVVITDRNGDNLSKTQLDSLEIKTASGALIKDTTVNAIVKLWKVKENIRLKVDTSKIRVADGYVLTSSTVNPASINLAGSDETLAALNGELVIEGIDNGGMEAASTIEQNIDLSEYLLDHYKKALKLENSSATAISVKIQIEKVGTKIVSVPVSDFNIVNQPEKMKLVLTPADKVPIEVRQTDDEAAPITAGDVKVTMDLSDYQEEGNYTVVLQVELPEGYALETIPSIKVNMEKIEPTTETTTAEE